MQMLFEGSEEAPEVPGLGVFPGRVRLLPDGLLRSSNAVERIAYSSA